MSADETLVLDCGAAAIKGILWRDRQPVKMFSVPTPQEAVRGGLLQDTDAVASAIRSVLSDYNPRRMSLGMIVHSQIAMIRMEVFPGHLADSQIRKILNVKEQINSFFPAIVAPGTYTYEWQIIAREGGKTSVLLGALPNQVLNQARQLAKALEIPTLRLLDAESTVLPYALPADRRFSEGYIIGMLGHDFATLIIYDHHVPLAAQSVPTLSAMELISRIAGKFRIPPSEAARRLRTYGTETDPEIFSEWRENLLQAIRQAAMYFMRLSNNVKQMRSVVLAGGLSHLPGLAELLKDDEMIWLPGPDRFPGAESGMVVGPRTFMGCVGLSLRWGVAG